MFTSKYRHFAEILAKQIDVPSENILGLAAHESQYGQGRFATEGNNFFSMHSPAPLQTGTITALGAPKMKVATFNSFLQSGQSFLARFGEAVRGKKDPGEFSKALVASHFNTGNAKTGGRPGYAKLVEDAIGMVKARMQCSL
jgi:hypothetical protein